jgi:hypothetical protein
MRIAAAGHVTADFTNRPDFNQPINQRAFALSPL